MFPATQGILGEILQFVNTIMNIYFFGTVPLCPFSYTRELKMLQFSDVFILSPLPVTSYKGRIKKTEQVTKFRIMLGKKINPKLA